MTATAIAPPAGATFPVSTAIVAKRDVLSFLRTPQQIIVSSVQLVGFLVVFRYLLGGAIGTSQGLPYVDFAVPGFIAAGVPFTLIGTAVAMAEDMRSGLIDRFRSLPMPRSAVLTGRVLADTVVLAYALGIATAVGFAIGFRLHGSVLEGLAAFGICLVFGLAFTWIFIFIGLVAGNGQAAQGMAMIVFPFTFASSAYIPVGTMPGWLQAFANNQPVTYMADAVRALTLGAHAQAFLGHSTGYYVTRSLLWSAGILIVFSVLSVVRFRRG